MLIIPTFLGVYTLLMTKTRGAIIGVLIGGVLLAALLYSIKKNNVKKTVLMILVSLAIVGCIGAVTVQSFHRSYDYERVLLLKSSYAMWEDHKLYGVGFRHWAREYPNYISPAAREPDLTIPHNVIASLVVSRFFRKFISSASKYRHQMYGFSSSAVCSISILNRCSMAI